MNLDRINPRVWLRDWLTKRTRRELAGQAEQDRPPGSTSPEGKAHWERAKAKAAELMAQSWLHPSEDVEKYLRDHLYQQATGAEFNRIWALLEAQEAQSPAAAPIHGPLSAHTAAASVPSRREGPEDAGLVSGPLSVPLPATPGPVPHDQGESQ